jgi:hypothetical protein
MIEVLREDEGAPASRPAPPADLFTSVKGEGGNPVSWLADTASQVPADALWERIESWITRRWGERTVTWIVRAPDGGEWEPRLRPASVDQAEKWDGEAWQTTTLQPAPVGYALQPGTFRVQATVGTSDDPPAIVWEAYRRLAMYVTETFSRTGGTTDFGEGTSQPASWPARSLIYSGAADALRRFR